MNAENYYIDTMTPLEASEELKKLGLHISAETIRRGLEQRVFPFGDAIQCDKSSKYFVYRKYFEQWLAEHVSVRGVENECGN